MKAIGMLRLSPSCMTISVDVFEISVARYLPGYESKKNKHIMHQSS